MGVVMGCGKYGSARADMVARWFGIDGELAVDARPACLSTPALDLRAGQLVLLTGASGAGKSTLLREIARGHCRRARWIDLQRVRLPVALVIDVMADALGGGRDEGAILAGLGALSRVGLGEVWTYLRRPGQLSDGQRWRLRVAIGLARAGNSCDALRGVWRRSRRLTVLAADEFAAPLDRITALVVARGLRKAVDSQRDLCAVVATTRDDLAAALQPDLTIHCDFGTYNHFSKGASHD
jgi:ABC-type ATPase with predicted acetyltransferase domain